MLLSGLLYVLVALLLGLVFFLPSYTAPPAADLSAFQVIAWLVPLDGIVTITGGLLAFVVASLTYVLVNWIIKKARGSG